MAKKKKLKYDPEWAKAKKLCRLSAEDVRMAKELGIKPRTLIKNNPSPQQQWKQPIKFWIRELYEKRQRQQRPAHRSAGPLTVQQESTSAPGLDDVPF